MSYSTGGFTVPSVLPGHHCAPELRKGSLRAGQ
jgi:hypothetical protein